VNPAEGVETVYGQVGVLTGDALYWLMILGPLTFWVLIPITRQIRDSVGEDAAN
jgi:hypothetical protein